MRQETARSVIATTRRGIARVEESASGDWSVQPLLTDEDVRALAADPSTPGVVYAGTQGDGVLRSQDGGRTWRPAGLSGKIVKSLAASRAEPGTVYAGTKPALVSVSRDGGASWTELESFRRIPWRWLWFSPAEPPLTAYVQAIALSPTDPNIILAGIEVRRCRPEWRRRSHLERSLPGRAARLPLAHLPHQQRELGLPGRGRGSGPREERSAVTQARRG